MDNILYADIVKRVRQLLIKKGIYNDAENYVNEAWLMLSDESKIIDSTTIYKKAVSLIVSEYFQNCYNTKDITKVCNCCKEDLPVAMFCQKWIKRLNRHITDYICKECKNKKTSKWVKNNLNRYRRYSQAYRDRLPDSYIIINLRKQGIPNPSRVQIKECRNRIIQKRSKFPERFCSTTV